METKAIQGLRVPRLDRVITALAAMQKPSPAPKRPPLVVRFLPTV